MASTTILSAQWKHYSSYFYIIFLILASTPLILSPVLELNPKLKLNFRGRPYERTGNMIVWMLHVTDWDSNYSEKLKCY